MISSRDGWLKPHIFNMKSRGGVSVFICFNDVPGGAEIIRTQGAGLTMRSAYLSWQKNGGKNWANQGEVA